MWKIHLFNHDTHLLLLSATNTVRRIGQEGEGEEEGEGGGGDCDEEMHRTKN
jgi:hypothetical protein